MSEGVIIARTTEGDGRMESKHDSEALLPATTTTTPLVVPPPPSPPIYEHQEDEAKGKHRRSYFSRWVILSVCMLTAYAAGSSYDFGLYSDWIQLNLGYSEYHISMMGSFANAGLYSMLLSGLILESVGPRISFLIGGCLSAIGYSCLWAIATEHIPTTVAASCFTIYLATFGASFFSVTCTTLTVANFPPRDRGKAVGVMKAFLGLGISINSQFYSTFFNSLDYLIGLAITLPLVAIIAATVVNFVPRRDLGYIKEETRHGFAYFTPWFILILGTALYVSAAVFVDAEFDIPSWGMDVLFIPTVAFAILGIAFLPFYYGPLKRYDTSYPNYDKQQAKEEGRGVKGEVEQEDDETQSLLDKPLSTLPPPLEEEAIGDDHDMNVLQMVRSLDFWLLFILFAISSGICLTVVNNIAALIDSFNSTEGEAVPLMLFGVFETAGRLSLSLSDRFQHSIARIFLLDLALLVLFICCLILAYDNIYTLNLCVVLVSYCYGFLYADVSAIIADLFGVQHFGGNLGFSLLAPIIGSFGIASGIVGAMYEDGCSGSRCFRYVFLTDAVLCLIATGILLALKIRLMDRHRIPNLAAAFVIRRTPSPR